MPARISRWTPDLEAKLSELVQTHSDREAAEAMGITEDAAKDRRLLMGILRPRDEHGKTWTPERLETLRKRRAEGLSAARIADEIGVTRNAVIGKCKRLGLPLAEIRRPRAKPTTLRKPRMTKGGIISLPRLVRLPRLVVDNTTTEAPGMRRVKLMDLEPHHCRFIPGDPGSFYCGADVWCESSYCAYHYAKCHQ